MKKISLIIALVFLNSLIFAQNKFPKENEVTEGPKPKDRPSVAIVLAGGGAKGFAELPIMELIEEMGIPVDMVIGTSIGSIIGGLYAAGYTSEEILKEFGSVDWTPLFADAGVSPYEKLIGDHSVDSNPIIVNFSNKFKMRMGNGISSGQNVYQLLKEKTIKYPSDMDFNDLPIPFRAIATNMLTGDAVVIDKGDLAEAMRASMSLPAVFSPFEMEGYYFMDGGLKDNLAVNVAKNMGYDIIIAIDISQHVRDNPEVFDANPAVAILNTITIGQQAMIQDDMKNATLVIRPDISSYGTMDFKEAERIYNEGKAVVSKYASDLEAIRRQIYPSDYDAQGKRISEYKAISKNSLYDEKTNLVVQKLKIIDGLPEDEKAIRKAFDEIKGQTFTVDRMDDFLSHIYLLGNYTTALPRLIKNENGYDVELHLKQRNKKQMKIMIEPGIEQTVSSSSCVHFDLAGEIQIRDMLGRNSIFALRGLAINDYEFNVYYLKGIGSALFAELNVLYYDDRYFSLSSLETSQSDFVRYESWEDEINIGASSPHLGVFRIGGFYDWGRSSNLGVRKDPYLRKLSNLDTASGGCFGPQIKTAFDISNVTHSDISGLYFATETRAIFPQENMENFSVLMSGNLKTSIPLGKKCSLKFNCFGGTDFTSRLDQSPAVLITEGFSTENREYYPQNTSRNRHGQNALEGTLILQIEPWNNITILGGKVILRLQGTVGNVTRTWDQMFNPTSDDMKDYRLLWNCCGGIGIELKKNYNMLLRAGFGSNDDVEMAPFVSLDIGSFSF